MILRRPPDPSRPVADLLQRLRQLDLGAGLAQVGRVEGLIAVHFAATMLAHADPTVAWQGMLEVCSDLSGAPSRFLPIPLAGRRRPGPVWAVWLPAGPHEAGAQPGSNGEFSVVAEHRLGGFPDGVMLELSAGAGRGPSSRDHDRQLQALVVTVSGLLNGTCQRLVEEAFHHARRRRSSGKPLWQHQAVGLRLGEVAMQQQALACYLETSVRSWAQDGQSRRAPSAEYPVGTALEIARHCLQITGAHGYVEGLPIRRLVEQVSTLCGALQLHSAAAHSAAARGGGTA